jgi:hypothetical protein
MVGGEPRPDHDETDGVAWFTPSELAEVALGSFARTLFTELGMLPVAP